ncbi:MAG TPA: DinB family protein [Symbiobacteriaceae bacterium]|nr:DinB family protein [Symbiobacteriaceae bacterium]
MEAAVAAVLARYAAVQAQVCDLAGVTHQAELTARQGERWSARDVLIQKGNCAEACAEDLTALITGETLQREYLPADEWNARHLARYAHLDGTGALGYYKTSARRLAEVAGALTAEHLASARSPLTTIAMTVEHEVSHTHQMRAAIAAARGDDRGALLHSLAYSRAQVLEALNVGAQPAALLQWKPPTGKWSALEHAIHLAVWDRHVAAVLAAKAVGGPAPAEPFPAGGLDAWNQATVADRSWWSPGAVIHELGAARGDLVAQIQRLPQDVFAAEAEGLRQYTSHDRHHAAAIWRVLSEAQA